MTSLLLLSFYYLNYCVSGDRWNHSVDFEPSLWTDLTSHPTSGTPVTGRNPSTTQWSFGKTSGRFLPLPVSDLACLSPTKRLPFYADARRLLTPLRQVGRASYSHLTLPSWSQRVHLPPVERLRNVRVPDGRTPNLKKVGHTIDESPPVLPRFTSPGAPRVLLTNTTT